MGSDHFAKRFVFGEVHPRKRFRLPARLLLICRMALINETGRRLEFLCMCCCSISAFCFLVKLAQVLSPLAWLSTGVVLRTGESVKLANALDESASEVVEDALVGNQFLQVRHVKSKI